MPTSNAVEPLGIILLRLQRGLERELIQGIQGAGYPDVRMRHLSVLETLGPEGARASALALHFDMTAQSMGELIDDLERSGYLSRVQDPADRRARILTLTLRGQVAIAACQAIVTEIEQRYESLLGRPRYQEARASLVELLRHVEGNAAT
ncbi:MarR family winged helix-turn-helix transcriptional regulator [Paenarthrobacter sp. NPDC056912]|uniref:MarR family winged helix-turn-helix transcriptional regulator n=1 Tax=Paenarthrobacter sp. NPDC056912 TaxID=3345965 RepID=UPI003670344E